MREDVLAQETVPSKFDTLGENLLQAVADNRSVVGGLRYLDKLAACQLDGTLESLKKIDKLLTAVRRDLLRQGLAENELKAVDFRNFVLYVAFYAGHVAKNMAGMALTWQAGETLGQQYPKINTKSFYQLMVLTALDGQSTPLFLLQNIGARLFASVQRTFVSPVDNEPVAESVYWAVDSWLTQFKIIATKAAVPLSQDDNGDTKAHLALQTSTAQKMPSALSQPTGSQATAHKAVSLSIQETVIQKPII
ncbi:MAG: hypothetical protein Q4G13_05415, partial [Moraxella sp.]|nr:hypothetical protein [Moraxella sp.]